jgi:hypothetical protein
MLSNTDNAVQLHFRKAGITEANSAFIMWSDARYPAAASMLTDFLNWMPSNDAQDDGEAEEIQEIAEAASQGTSCPASPLSPKILNGAFTSHNKLVDWLTDLLAKMSASQAVTDRLTNTANYTVRVPTRQ